VTEVGPKVQSKTFRNNFTIAETDYPRPRQAFTQLSEHVFCSHDVSTADPPNCPEERSHTISSYVRCGQSKDSFADRAVGQGD
jgi:hypothetical protein